MANCLEMVKPDGHLLIHAPANNYFGHGFYQFSPELFFRALSPFNGFHLERMIAVELGPRRKWYEAAAPEAVQARVALINSLPFMLFILAKKTAVTLLFDKSVQLNGYNSQWQNQDMHSESANCIQKSAQRLLEVIPGTARFMESLIARLMRTRSFKKRRSFKKLSDTC